MTKQKKTGPVYGVFEKKKNFPLQGPANVQGSNKVRGANERSLDKPCFPAQGLST